MFEPPPLQTIKLSMALAHCYFAGPARQLHADFDAAGATPMAETPARLGARAVARTQGGPAADALGGLPSATTPSGTVAPLPPSPPSTGPSPADAPATSALAPGSPPFKAVHPRRRSKRTLRTAAPGEETPSTAGPPGTEQQQQQTITPTSFELELGELETEAAHRAVCYLAHGPPPQRCSEAGEVWIVVHLCHNRACLNPFHLCWGLSLRHNQSMLNFPLIKARVDAHEGNITSRKVHASMHVHEALKETLIGGDFKAEVGAMRQQGYGNLLLTAERALHFIDAQATLAQHLNNN